MLLKFMFFSILFFLNSASVCASFDLQSNTATYNSNNGFLTVFHSDFNVTDYKAYPQKFKLGNVVINATTKFESGLLKVFVLNKNEVNQQNGLSTTGILSNALSMDHGAVFRSYRPPNSINVVLESQSNAKKLNVSVTGLIPTIQIDEMSSNVNQVEGENKSITITLKGKNLDTGDFEVRELNSHQKYVLSKNKINATVIIQIPTNNTNVKRIYTFVLYLNGQETTQKVTIEVLPFQKEITKPDEKPVVPPDNETVKPKDESIKKEENVTNNNDPFNNNNQDNNIQEKEENHISSDEKVIAKDDSLSSEKNGNHSYNLFYILCVLLSTFLIIIVLIHFKKKK